RIRKTAKNVASALGETIHDIAKKTEEYARTMVTGGTFFEELGFHYLGPFDGHDIDVLTRVLKNAKEYDDRPVLIHVVTKKGKGYAPDRKSVEEGQSEGDAASR